MMFNVMGTAEPADKKRRRVVVMVGIDFRSPTDFASATNETTIPNRGVRQITRSVLFSMPFPAHQVSLPVSHLTLTTQASRS
jgi:hypothetical protein